MNELISEQSIANYYIEKIPAESPEVSCIPLKTSEWMDPFTDIFISYNLQGFNNLKKNPSALSINI